MHLPVERLRPVLVTAPSVAPITLAEVKAFAVVDFDDDDALLQAMLNAAVAHVDGWSGILGRCMINQTWRQDFGQWRRDLRLPFPDVSSVTVKYYDTLNALQTVSAASYELIEDGEGKLVRFVEDFDEPDLYDDRSDALQVTLVAGYGAAESAVPQAIRTALCMLVNHWYANRGAVGDAMSEIPAGVTALLAPYRRSRF